MFRYLPKLMLFILVAFPATLLIVGPAYAQEDPIEEEDDAPSVDEDAPYVDTPAPEDDSSAQEDDDTDSKVETDEEEQEQEAETATTADKDSDDEEEEKPSGIGPSTDTETVVLFPDYPDKQLPAGKPIRVLVGFGNKAEKDFIIETLDASFRYPQDYSYHIQNFTASLYNSVVQSGQEASFEYSFFPHESYGGRPFGLIVMLMYKDNEGNQFGAGVFNETVTFLETDDSFDGEQFFLYLMLAAIALLVVFGANYAFSSIKGGKRKYEANSEAFEQGTQNGDVDYDWLPKETLTEFNKASPRRSPRQRRVNRGAGSSSEE